MYLPYVRGKQFDLLALKEMAPHLAANPQILPVIEPVRARGEALIRCVDALSVADVPVTVVVNPGVGELAGGDGHRSVIALLERCKYRSHLRLAVLVRAGLNVGDVLRAVNASSLASCTIDLVHQEFAGAAGVADLVGATSLHLLHEKAVVRRYRTPPLDGGLVKFEDRFPEQRTNLQYVGVPASLFTDDNIYYAQDGYAGWGDYATIGDVYSEGGSSPRAVAIHLTYLNRDDDAIWIRHFCSESNEDTADTPGKFGEAVANLVAFCDGYRLDNPAVAAFRSYASSGAFPGLGMVKKLSIQNHLYVATEAMTKTLP